MCSTYMNVIYLLIRVITKLPNSEQSYVNVNALSRSLDNKYLIVIMWKGTQVHIRA